jgi:hypothetical protein
MLSFYELDVFEWTNKVDGKRIILGHWIYAMNENEKGEIVDSKQGLW